MYFLLAPHNALVRKVCSMHSPRTTSLFCMCVQQVVFSQITGPITWSIILQRNSMVLHSLDKVPLLTTTIDER